MDEEVRVQLMELEKPREQEDCFYKHLEFGTGGMRGIIGPGINRMNRYTIRKAAEGLARYIDGHGDMAKHRGVVIAYDSRHYSPEFAEQAARVIGHHGIQVYLFDGVRTTPELSFAIRYLHAFSGIVITASHNPAAYNGFKVYGEDGAQFASADADIIVEHVNSVEDELLVPVSKMEELKEKGLFSMIGDTVDNAYLREVDQLLENREAIQAVADTFTIVYTPLHGTGGIPVQRGLKKAGFKHVHLVQEQAEPDGSFPTVIYPNPEEPAAFSKAIRYGEQLQADLLMATDPDADRMGVAVPGASGKRYELLTGNQIGAILLHYLITVKKNNGTLHENATVIKTIVTSELGRDIAATYGIKTIDTLTGFKYISEKIREFETTKQNSFLFGYEESYGFLAGDFVRDKDAVQTCVLIAEAAAFYKQQDKTLYDVLQDIFAIYGYYREGLESVTLAGRDGVEEMEAIIRNLREHPPMSIAGKKVLVREDYATSERVFPAIAATTVFDAENKTGAAVKEKKETIHLPISNVLKYKLEDGAWFCVRPSGTEPKIKLYFGVKENSAQASEAALENIAAAVMKRVGVATKE